MVLTSVVWCPTNKSHGDCETNYTDGFNSTAAILYEFRYSFPVTVFFCIAYTLVFLVGVTGNCFVVSVVWRSPRMRSPTNLFIANLACADLLVNIICLPFTLVSNVMSAWTMGWLVCKTIPYLQGVSVNASINTLVAISVERCLAICYPMRWQVTSRAVRIWVFIIWTFSLSITLPWALFFQLLPLEEGSELQTCLETWPTPHSGNVYFVVANLFMCYLLPLILISICYVLIYRKVRYRRLPGEPQANGEQMIHRSKMKVIKMLVVVIALFASSWLPLYAIFTRIKLGGPLKPGLEETLVHALLPVAQWLGSSNSCINPILYAYFNRKFRAGFQAILSSRSCCSPLRYDYSSQMTISGRDTIYGRKTADSVPVKKSMNRMTISTATPYRPKGRGHEVSFNPRSLSLRGPTSLEQNFLPNNFRPVGQEIIKNAINTTAKSEFTKNSNVTFV